MKKKDFFIILIAVVLLIVALLCIYFEYKENNQNKQEENTNNIEITEEGYLVVETKEDEEKVIYVSEIVENDNNTYTLKGNLGELYTITEDEYDYLKNQVPLVVDGIDYYFTWSDEYNEYIFVSEENDKVYYLQKTSDDTYLVCLDSEDMFVYKESETKAQITLDQDIECIVSDEVVTLSNWAKNKNIEGKYIIKLEEDNSVKVIVNLT